MILTGKKSVELDGNYGKGDVVHLRQKSI